MLRGDEAQRAIMTTVLCNVCLQKIVAENERVYCFGGCYKIFHAKCSELNSAAVSALRHNVGLKYMCFDCRKDQTDLNALKNHCSEIASKVNVMSETIDGFNTKLNETVKAKLDDLQSSLQMHLKELIGKEIASIQLPKTDLVTNISYADVTRSSLNAPTALNKRKGSATPSNSSSHRIDSNTPVGAAPRDRLLCANDDDRGWLRSGKRRRIKSTTVVNSGNLVPNQSRPAEVVVPPAPKTSMITKIEQTVLIKPLNSQSVEKTKHEIQQKLDPVTFAVKDVRFKESGEASIRCESRELALNLVSAAKELLSNYSVEIQNALKPRVNITGFAESVTQNELVRTMRKQNASLQDLKDEEMRVIRLKKNEKHISNPMSALVEVDSSLFVKLVKLQRVNIAWNRCRVVEDINVNQCYNCFEFGHKARDCTAPACCPKCADCHDFDECESDFQKCVNCSKHNRERHIDDENQLDIAHSSWSSNCPILQRRRNRARQRIDYSS